MSDDIEAAEAGSGRSVSRRSALKAGVGVGVGVAAWSGPTITSLGGTPAYAAGCTFAVQEKITDDRNTDQSHGCKADTGGLGYHENPAFVNVPADIHFTPNGWNSHVCSKPPGNGWGGYTLKVHYPASLNCSIKVEMRHSNGGLLHTFTIVGDPPLVGSSIVGPEEPSDAYPGHNMRLWRLPTSHDAVNQYGGHFPSDTRYSIYLECITSGDEDCFS